MITEGVILEVALQAVKCQILPSEVIMNIKQWKLLQYITNPDAKCYNARNGISRKSFLKKMRKSVDKSK